MRTRAADESGVVLVLTALMMVAVLGMAAMAVDTGSFFQAQRKAQAAADAGALAAAGSIAAGTSTTAGQSYATNNDPGATASVHSAGANAIKVTVNTTTPTYFGHVLGLNQANISATAVATADTTGGDSAAIWAADTVCGDTGLSLGTSDLTVIGGVHSNGPLSTSGHDSHYSSGVYGGPNSCSYSDSTGGQVTFDSARTPTFNSGDPAWPENYAYAFPVSGGGFSAAADPNCTYIGTDLRLQSLASTTLASGTYCDQTIEFNESNLSCARCTFVASQSIQFNSGYDSFSPAYKDLQFYDMQSGSVNVDANGDGFLGGGTDFLPNADVTVNDPSDSVSGFVEAQDVTTNGGGCASSTWTGTGPVINSTGVGATLTQ
jgi:Flp pilus assembly protein TadG